MWNDKIINDGLMRRCGNGRGTDEMARTHTQNNGKKSHGKYVC